MWSSQFAISIGEPICVTYPSSLYGRMKTFSSWMEITPSIARLANDLKLWCQTAQSLNLIDRQPAPGLKARTGSQKANCPLSVRSFTSDTAVKNSAVMPSSLMVWWDWKISTLRLCNASVLQGPRFMTATSSCRCHWSDRREGGAWIHERPCWQGPQRSLRDWSLRHRRKIVARYSTSCANDGRRVILEHVPLELASLHGFPMSILGP